MENAVEISPQALLRLKESFALFEADSIGFATGLFLAKDGVGSHYGDGCCE